MLFCKKDLEKNKKKVFAKEVKATVKEMEKHMKFSFRHGMEKDTSLLMSLVCSTSNKQEIFDRAIAKVKERNKGVEIQEHWGGCSNSYLGIKYAFKG